ncbi:MAG: urea transporter [Bacteroidetes bacterium]|nr:urea transporter [Bacteroidota bacterium]
MNYYRKLFAEGILKSYAQIFFSASNTFASIILVATLINPTSGVAGLISLLFTMIFAVWFGFSHVNIRNGIYGFNSILTGLLIGSFFQFSLPMFILLFIASLLNLLITIGFSGIASRYHVPFLSLPFLFTCWLILLAAGNYHGLTTNDFNVFIYSKLYWLGGQSLVDFYDHLKFYRLPLWMDTYFKSLGAILFQYNLLSGLLIAAGLLYFSRIAFSLSLIGFISGYFTYHYLFNNTTGLDYSFYGFNFILTSIGIGGFFLIPNKYSYSLAILLSVLSALVIGSVSNFFNVFHLPVYSLPFCILIILTLYTMQFRWRHDRFIRVIYQLISPEKNLYRHLLYQQRYRNTVSFDLFLPFNGVWHVSQGYNGKQTHREDWKHALDFVIRDEEKKTYRLPGTSVEHYYCYNLPVVAPAAGWVEKIVDGVFDNDIGDVDVNRNWGNTIVIRHSNFLFSQVSHLKKGTFKVRVGDYVNKGDVLAMNGNSGRSPEPHIHFQLQATSQIGSKTIPFPISFFMKHDGDRVFLKSYEVPAEGDTISNVEVSSVLKDAFHFIPGKKFVLQVTGHKKEPYYTTWEVFTDAYNNSYLYCSVSKAVAYFTNNGTVHQFTSFSGEQDSALFHFYLAAYRVLLGFYDRLSLDDALPLDVMHNRFAFLIQDWIAPFKVFMKADYRLDYSSRDNDVFTSKMTLNSTCCNRYGKKMHNISNYEMNLSANRIDTLKIDSKNKHIELKFIPGK